MIASEGKIILIPLLLMILAGTGVHTFSPSASLKWINLILVVLTIFSLYFFREPQRITPNLDGFLSPADGEIVKIIDMEDDEIGNARQISIFLSVFNIHSQWVPLSGKVISKHYSPGKYLAAFNHKASLDNEQTSVTFETENGEKYIIKQIAGMIARRILNYMEPENTVQRGDRLGFIRFGSRVDIIVPEDFHLNVSIGDMVQGNKTIIGNF